MFLAILREMFMVPSRIALLFISRSAGSEGRAKQWLGRGRGAANAAIAELLIERARMSIARAGLDIVYIDEAQQRGECFGSRLANAFVDVFAMGYTAVVAVGNDSPRLVATDWEAVTAVLARGESVLGPTLRGGAYLIGLQAHAFDAMTFASLPWQSNALYDHLIAWLSGQLPYELPALRDLNTLHDLQIAARADSTAFAKRLKSMLVPTPCLPSALTWVAYQDAWRLPVRPPPTL